MPRGTLFTLSVHEMCVQVYNPIWYVKREYIYLYFPSLLFYANFVVGIYLETKRRSKQAQILRRIKYQNLDQKWYSFLPLFLSLSLSLSLNTVVYFELHHVITPSSYVLGKSLGAVQITLNLLLYYAVGLQDIR